MTHSKRKDANEVSATCTEIRIQKQSMSAPSVVPNSHKKWKFTTDKFKMNNIEGHSREPSSKKAIEGENGERNVVKFLS